MKRPALPPNAKLVAALIAGLLLLGASAPCLAVKRKNSAAKSSKIRFDKGSEESPQERAQRLLRECKGRPNAGACEGFAS